ncbi:tetratricopeptide repeat protein [Brucella anthropi]|uniref:tetratricopeptide repeat protein n=1 Tax=Brucella TaxID=234 RepID=UPI001951CF67|nr:hypothetical protein [Brucella anthropi]MBM6394480.1 hypothetical protein [Brucella anthropi]
MIENDEPDERHAIPRWLSIHQSKLIGELDGISSVRPIISREALSNVHGVMDEEFSRSILNWRVLPDEANAEELLSIALIVNKTEDKEVHQAAELLAKDIDQSSYVIQFAKKILGSSEEVSETLPHEIQNIRLAIANQKKLLSLNPRDSLRLTETALLYASIGHNKSSRSFLRRAVILAPDNRYVLRSASRFFVHMNEHEYALELLESSPRTKNDPWLKAASLAIGATIGHQPQHWRKAKSLLTNTNFSSRALSELAVQVGTLEFDAGSRRQAIRLLKQGAESPTENAVAQIEWISRRKKIFSSNESIVDISLSHEASAYDAYEKGDWQDALSRCESWHEIESFSVRPTIFGSFIAAVTSSDIDRGLALANSGLIANPKNITLLNNCAVLQACSGRIDDAERSLSKAFTMDRDADEHIMLTATEGLLNFRSGNYENGISSYSKAINLALESPTRSLAFRAYCFMARELSRIDIESSQFAQAQLDGAFQQANERGIKIPNDLIFIYNEIKNKNDSISSLNLSNIPILDSHKIPSIID